MKGGYIKMAMPTNVSESYLKSLGKSFGYASLSVFEKYNPTLTNIYKSGKEVIRDINRSSNEERKEEAHPEVNEKKEPIVNEEQKEE